MVTAFAAPLWPKIAAPTMSPPLEDTYWFGSTEPLPSMKIVFSRGVPPSPPPDPVYRSITRLTFWAAPVVFCHETNSNGCSLEPGRPWTFDCREDESTAPPELSG